MKQLLLLAALMLSAVLHAQEPKLVTIKLASGTYEGYIVKEDYMRVKVSCSEWPTYKWLYKEEILNYSEITGQQTETIAPYANSGIIYVTDTTASAQVLFDKTMHYLNVVFKDLSAVITVKDRESGVIEGNGNIPYSMLIPIGKEATGFIGFKLSIRFKNGKVKYELTNFSHLSTATGYPSFGVITNSSSSPKVMWPLVNQDFLDMQWRLMQDKCKSASDNLISGLTNELNTTDDNW